MVSHQWKGHERFVAKSLGGHRIPRGANFSRSLPDVVADSSVSLPGTKGLIFAECKYSVNNPWVRLIADIYDNDVIIVPGKHTTDPFLIMFELSDISKLFNYRNKHVKKYKKQIPDYISSHLQQSCEYLDTVMTDPVTKASLEVITGLNVGLPKLPIVVMAEKGKSFRLAYTSNYHFDNFLFIQNIILDDKGNR